MLIYDIHYVSTSKQTIVYLSYTSQDNNVFSHVEEDDTLFHLILIKCIRNFTPPNQTVIYFNPY